MKKLNITIEEANKALVLEAFDTLFNKRNYKAAERFWSPNYIQHSAHIAPGREGLFNLIKSLPPTLKYEPGTIVAQRRLRDRAWAIFGFRPAGELDRGGYSSHRERDSGGALGCDPRRGHARVIQEWPSHVRRQVWSVATNQFETTKERSKNKRGTRARSIGGYSH
jgi:hypothetical protein